MNYIKLVLVVLVFSCSNSLISQQLEYRFHGYQLGEKTFMTYDEIVNLLNDSSGAKDLWFKSRSRKKKAGIYGGLSLLSFTSSIVLFNISTDADADPGIVILGIAGIYVGVITGLVGLFLKSNSNYLRKTKVPRFYNEDVFGFQEKRSLENSYAITTTSNGLGLVYIF